MLIGTSQSHSFAKEVIEREEEIIFVFTIYNEMQKLYYYVLYISEVSFFSFWHVSE